MIAFIAALVLNLAVGPNGLLVPDGPPASGLTGAMPPSARRVPALIPPPPPLAVRETRRPCPAPADLPPNSSVAYRTAPGDVPADLPGPRMRLPRKIEMGLGETVGPPAPDYSQLYLGGAEIDTKTGAVAINGTSFAPQLSDCP